ncbi:MAG: hypothetical protein JO041_02985, partial [Acidobacteria bacterium]|nr:hypothetical protein [Acidobacteriota bacterium]
MFHASTHLVQINVVVRDHRGHPVADLSKDDFTVIDRGKPEIVSFLSPVGPNPRLQQQRQALPPNTFSNEARYHSDTPGSVTLILLDNLNTLSSSSPQPYETTPFWVEDHALANAKHHLIEFLKGLDSANRIAIYGLNETLSVLCDFTCTRDQLVAAVTRYDPASKTRREAVEPGDFNTPVPGDFNPRMNADTRGMAALNNEARAQTTMASLSAIVAHMADIPGRKNLLWLTGNVPFAPQAIARILGR